MNSHEIRRRFLEFFASREHRVVPSSPLILPNDLTLLFANAGMNQFKDLFLGREARDYRRAASSQKCLRVSGKHNDLEMVGRTPRHHTLFEMLGNFSFGDYFKSAAVAYAWELLRDGFGVPEDRLWVTVFRGNDALAGDEEAFRIWRDEIGVREDRILRLGEKDNFWRMGETGPCGPCSEIFYDLGESLTSVTGVSNPETDDARYIEIWNLVFMQFDQGADGVLRPLPAPSIDTGMGLERIAAVLQQRTSNYDTDLFRPLLEVAAECAGTRYGQDPQADFSMRVIADHARAFCFLVADGVVPANDKRGYVLRRLLRRAIRHGRKLGIEGPFLERVTPVVVENFGAVYPELGGALDAIQQIGRLEERRFSETLATGLALFEEALAEAAQRQEGAAVLEGQQLFRLYDTFGFPLDLARDIAEERSVTLDEAGFEREMARQRERAQASWKGADHKAGPAAYGEWQELSPTRFEGYTTTQLDAVRVLGLLRDGKTVRELPDGADGEVLLEASPFYAESGGQVGDRGILTAGSVRASVLDVQRPLAGRIVHHVRVVAGRLALGETVHAEVDAPRRRDIRRNHTATHLLHAALREVVGTHVKQAGSLVAADRLRFDFSHFDAVSARALSDIESLVNEQVLQDIEVETDLMQLDEALRRGAMALFGEKYGERVRVVRIGEFSMELCGGTHCARSGEIGLIKLTQERGIASGTRRIEAVTGTGSLARFRDEHAIVRALEEQLSVSREKVLEEIDRRLEQMRRMQKQSAEQQFLGVRDRLAQELDRAEIVAGFPVFARRVDGLPAEKLRELADHLRQKLSSGVVVLGRAESQKAALLVAVSDDLKRRVPAGDLVRLLARRIGGGGGGRPEMAEAGGKEPQRLDEALQAASVETARLLEESDSEA